MIDVQPCGQVEYQGNIMENGGRARTSSPFTRFIPPATGLCVFVGLENKRKARFTRSGVGQSDPPRRLEPEGDDNLLQDLAFSPRRPICPFLERPPRKEGAGAGPGERKSPSQANRFPKMCIASPGARTTSGKTNAGSVKDVGRFTRQTSQFARRAGRWRDTPFGDTAAWNVDRRRSTSSTARPHARFRREIKSPERRQPGRMLRFQLHANALASPAPAPCRGNSWSP